MVLKIAYGNGEQIIDASIYGIQCYGRGGLRIPFASHVRQVHPSLTEPNVPFHQFTRLPAELQLRVVGSCDKPTLFQLMQTSHLIRTEARKIFFADPETWYCVDGSWLEDGGHPTDAIYDMDFLRCIQRLHVDGGLIGGYWWKDTTTFTRTFWSQVRRLFPQAKHIMLSDDMKTVPSDAVGSSTDIWTPPKLYSRLCQLCPADITVFVSLIRQDDSLLKRNMWQRTTIQEDDSGLQDLEKCESHPGPSIIVPKKPCRGRVGEFQYLDTWERDLTSRDTALRYLRIATVEHHHFHGRHEAFGCPASDCDAWFNEPGEYTEHVKYAREPHDESYVLPEPHQSVFADVKKRLEQLRQLKREETDTFLEWWGKFGSEERRVAEEEFVRELEEDASLYVGFEEFFKKRWLYIAHIWDQPWDGQ